MSEQATRVFCRAFADGAQEIKSSQGKILREAMVLGDLCKAQNELVDSSKKDLIAGVHIVDGGKVVILHDKETYVEYFKS